MGTQINGDGGTVSGALSLNDFGEATEIRFIIGPPGGINPMGRFAINRLALGHQGAQLRLRASAGERAGFF